MAAQTVSFQAWQGFPLSAISAVASAVFRSGVRGLPLVASATALHIGTRHGGCRYHRGRRSKAKGKSSKAKVQRQKCNGRSSKEKVIELTIANPL